MRKKITPEELAAAYSPLFELMAETYDQILTAGEMDDIIYAVEIVDDNLSELYKEYCDVEGCDKPPVSQGAYFRETGYWHLCNEHSFMTGNRPCPAMKKEAIDRETSRLSDGTQPISPIVPTPKN